MRSEYEAAFHRFHDAISAGQGDGNFQFAADRLAEDIGLPRFAYHSTGSNFDFVSNYPDEWVDHYVQSKYDAFDPLVKVSHQLDTVYWNRDFYKRSKSTRQLINESSEFGLAVGVTIPLPARFGGYTGMTFSGSNGEAVSSLQEHGIAELTKCAMYFDIFHKGKKTHLKDKLSILTAREIECLAWIARGKSFIDIAGIVGSSERTIARHSENIREKLNATTLANALWIAIQSGELNID